MKKLGLGIVALLLLIGGSVGFIFFNQSNKEDENQDLPSEVVNQEKNNEMTSLYFYDESRHQRYLDYQEVHPDYSVDQVVWQVNVDMDKEDYTDMVVIDQKNENDIVLLVNKHFRLRDDYEPEHLVTYNGYYEMTPETKDAFTTMAEEASYEEIYLNPGSTYRSVAYQRDLYQYYADADGVAEADTYSARAGSSEHHTGRAIDLVGPDWTLDSFGGSAASDWIIDHAWEYGFIIRYQEATEYITGYMDEPWHITYVGKKASEVMHKQNIDTLEEYYVKYVMYSPE